VGISVPEEHTASIFSPEDGITTQKNINNFTFVRTSNLTVIPPEHQTPTYKQLCYLFHTAMELRLSL
jgi:hypothetical protein